MIKLTRLRGADFVLNCELIETLECTPDTVISIINGKKFIVSESIEEVIEKVVQYKRRLYVKMNCMEGKMTEKKENMESKKSTSVLIVIIAALTLTLVVLSIFVVFSSKTSQEFLGLKFGSNFSLETKMPKRPSQNEMATKRLFEENVIYNLKNDNGELSVIQVNVVIEYYKKVKGIRNVEKKINSFESAMRELVGNYFQNMTISEVKDPNTRLKAKEDLTIEINDLLNSDENKYYQIVYDVIFEKWFYQ